MGTIKLMHAKLHQVRVTEANVNYIGSITIDQNLIEQVGILPLEEVEIVNLSNGKRFSTYVFPGKRGSGEVCPNGGAALLCSRGDILIIYAYEMRERAEVLKNGHQAKVLVADENNNCQQFFEQSLIPNSEHQEVEFHSVETITRISGHNKFEHFYSYFI
ncbi:aspartate 1-decarboxylase [Aphanothece hegewaldii CCALA 016]|uniref:Aspartate 1-decarboxylase n=1 Tax=Aphanothece hegewaldii CCALA 016 TaxID=2107694 RepID=A0A2T1LWW9_9CHRO|nr:aspartate 1-decarboxylase [Aphanothece hegewaldii]PSF36599.1 aspartate 1-decarboxylase [Aphanothece hegewaldii CCALA 016]